MDSKQIHTCLKQSKLNLFLRSICEKSRLLNKHHEGWEWDTLSYKSKIF